MYQFSSEITLDHRILNHQLPYRNVWWSLKVVRNEVKMCRVNLGHVITLSWKKENKKGTTHAMVMRWFRRNVDKINAIEY